MSKDTNTSETKSHIPLADITCFSLDIKVGDIVIREGIEYVVDSIDDDGECMAIINDDDYKYIMADDCKVIKRNCR